MGVVGEKDFGTVADAERTQEQGSCSNSASDKPTASSTENQDVEARGNNKDQDKTKYSVPFYKLFSFADSTDVVLMVLGSLGAMGNGLALPIMTILFGNLIQSFGGASNLDDVIDEVSKVCVSSCSELTILILHIYVGSSIIRIEISSMF